MFNYLRDALYNITAREEEYSQFKIVPCSYTKGCDCELFYRVYGYRRNDWEFLDRANTQEEAYKIVEHYQQKVIYVENKGS